jgi:hypothetical protein
VGNGVALTRLALALPVGIFMLSFPGLCRREWMRGILGGLFLFMALKQLTRFFSPSFVEWPLTPKQMLVVLLTMVMALFWGTACVLAFRSARSESAAGPPY